MKPTPILILCGAFILSLSCQAIQTIADLGSTPTGIPTETSVRAPTFTPRAANTPQPTAIPTRGNTATPTRPPATAKPTNPPPPPFKVQTQKIGPISDTGRNEQYTLQVSVTDVKFLTSSGYDKPKSGNVYAVVSVDVQNAGPGTVYSLYTTDFQIKDSNGAVRGDTYVTAARDCNLDLVDLAAGGTIDGCIGFEVPAGGRLEFIYAPYKYEGLKPGRYLSFVIR